MGDTAPTRRSRSIRAAITFAIASTLCASFTPLHAQTATGWKGTAGNNNWTSAGNWDNTAPGAGARDLFFGNGWLNAGGTGSTTADNNLADFHGHKIFFEGLANPITFTIGGNEIELFDFGGASPVYPQIYNNSTAPQIINAPIRFNDTSATAKAEINVIGGDFQFGNTVDLDGTTQLQIWGNNQKTVRFNGAIVSRGNGGANSFVIRQNSTVIFNAANTYTGNTFIDAGRLQFDAGGSITSTIRLGATTGTANAAVDLLPAAGGVTMSRTINPRAGTSGNVLSVNSLNSSGVNTLSGHFGLDHDLLVTQSLGGTLNVTQLRADDTSTSTGFDIKGFTAQFFAAGDIHVSGTIYNSTGSGTVVKNGDGVMTLSSTNTYTGPTTINEGVLRIGAGTTSGAISPTSVVTSTGVGGTIAFNRSDAVTFTNGIGGNVAIAQIGTGTTTITGANTSTAGTTISAGTLRVGAGTTSGSLGTGAIHDDGQLVVDRSDSIAFSGPITGTGSLTHAGTGTTILVGAHTYTGSTHVTAGTLQLGDGVGNASLQSAAIANDANLVVHASGSLLLSTPITGTGALYARSQFGTITLAASASHMGGTTNESALRVGAGTTSGSLGDGAVNNAGLLIFDRSDTMQVVGTISGAGAVAQAGSGTTVITGNNAYTGGTSVNAGTIVVAHVSGLGSGSLATVGGSVVVTSGITGAVKLNGLSIANPTTVDLTDNDLIVTSATPKATIEGYIVSARNGGSWDGSGLTSSAARDHATHSTTLGVLSGQQYIDLLGAGATFGGVLVDPGDTLVKHTWYGDTDFNGVVNFDDYARIDAGFNNGGNDWFHGDFDLNGQINFDDYALIDLAFNTQTGILMSSVPEPAALPLALASLDALSMRRGRRRQI